MWFIVSMCGKNDKHFEFVDPNTLLSNSNKPFKNINEYFFFNKVHFWFILIKLCIIMKNFRGSRIVHEMNRNKNLVSN